MGRGGQASRTLLNGTWSAPWQTEQVPVEPGRSFSPRGKILEFLLEGKNKYLKIYGSSKCCLRTNQAYVSCRCLAAREQEAL